MILQRNIFFEWFQITSRFEGARAREKSCDWLFFSTSTSLCNDVPHCMFIDNFLFSYIIIRSSLLFFEENATFLKMNICIDLKTLLQCLIDFDAARN